MLRQIFFLLQKKPFDCNFFAFWKVFSKKGRKGFSLRGKPLAFSQEIGFALNILLVQVKTFGFGRKSSVFGTCARGELVLDGPAHHAP